VNAAFLIMSTAALAGADPAPAAPAPAAPMVVSGAGCNNCGAPAGCCDKKPGLLDKIKSRISGWGHKSHSCGCAPAPAPAPAPCNACPCGAADRPNLLDKLKARWGSKKSCAPACDPCGTHTAPPARGGTNPPKEMPKPKDEKPKGNSASAPPIPAVPPLPGAGTSPY
jgi:hypothetical protein